MLWNASSLNGYTIEASDGRVGTVHDLLFDDLDWIIRWLVVSTGDDVGHKVLLPVSALGIPDASLRQFPVNLTVQQVRNSPDVETDLPVSRQIEEALYHFYGWAPYWQNSGTLISNSIVKPLFIPLQMLEPNPTDRDRAGAAPPDGDPNLRSIAVVTKYNIHAVDGNIGHIDDFLVQDDNWIIRYIIVDTKNWWPGEKVLISPRAMREINWEEKTFHLNVNRRKVKDSPTYDPTCTADGAYDEQFLKYFGINWVKK
jgi:hypothetical protein